MIRASGAADRKRQKQKGQTESAPQSKRASGGTLDDKNIQAALEYSKAHGGLSLVIQESGKITFEDYHNGYSKDSAHRLASGTKSFSGAILAALIHDREVSSFDEKVSEVITEWKDDADKSQITLRQLLSLTSGIDPGGTKTPTYREAVNARVVDRPGHAFRYGSTAFQVFGEFVKRKLKKENALDYLKRRIFAPIGLEVADWRILKDGNPEMPAGAFLKATEWIKFGELMMREGSWGGKQVIEARLLDELSLPSKVNPAYGITFWLSADPSVAEGAPESQGKQKAAKKAKRRTPPASSESDTIGGKLPGRSFMAAGAGQQRLYVVRGRELVIVRQGDKSKPVFTDSDFVGLLKL
jgi:CubicO group peptidase (beta-lactamase class C family)